MTIRPKSCQPQCEFQLFVILYIFLRFGIILVILTIPVILIVSRPVRRGVFKGEEDGRRSPALRAAHPPNGHKAVWGVAHPQGI
jgi:hypothetical protein